MDCSRCCNRPRRANAATAGLVLAGLEPVADGKVLEQQELNLLAAIGLVACAGFFIWRAILAAGGTSSQIPHNVARGKLQMFVSTLCALGIGVGALAINTFYAAGNAAASP